MTLSFVMGSWKSRAPVASNTALARTAPMLMMGGSPPPDGGMVLFSTITVSIFGRQTPLEVDFEQVEKI